MSTQNLERLLRDIPSLDLRERAYVLGVFDQFRSGGISKQEVIRAVHELSTRLGDRIEPREANEIREKLLAALE